MTSDHAAARHEARDHDPADIDRHVRVYIMVFVALMVLTIVTVAVSRFHLSVPVAVAVALLVATVKGALVACYFMHLISEKKLILAVLAPDRAFFVVLLALPVAHRTSNGFWMPTNEPQVYPRGADPLSAALAVLFGLWSLGVAGREHGIASLLAAIASFAVAVGLVVYDSWFLRKTRTLR